MRYLPALLVTVLLVVSTGCDSSGTDGTDVRLGFRVENASLLKAKTAVDMLEITGSNGTLRIMDVRLIAAEFELERISDEDCDLLTGEAHDNCEEFELPPFFVDLPLDETRVTIGAANIEPDTYDELEFEVENLDDDDGNPGVADALLTDIRAQFPDWPQKASVLLEGEFEPTGGTPQPYRVYVDAEIEIEMDLSPPLTIDADGVSEDLTIVVDPAMWLLRTDGTVVDLSAADFSNTGDLYQFEVEFENGFKEIEFDD